MHLSTKWDRTILFRTGGVVLKGEKRFLRRPTQEEMRTLKLEVMRSYTVRPETLAQLRPSTDR